MSAQSTIEWTGSTWNPVRGCTKISPGCAHCYAEVFAERFRGVPGHPYERGPAGAGPSQACEWQFRDNVETRENRKLETGNWKRNIRKSKLDNRKSKLAPSDSLRRRPTSGKHLLQCFQRGSQNCLADVSQSFDEPDLVQRPELVQKNQPSLSLKSN